MVPPLPPSLLFSSSRWQMAGVGSEHLSSYSVPESHKGQGCANHTKAVSGPDDSEVAFFPLFFCVRLGQDPGLSSQKLSLVAQGVRGMGRDGGYGPLRGPGCAGRWVGNAKIRVKNRKKKERFVCERRLCVCVCECVCGSGRDEFKRGSLGGASFIRSKASGEQLMASRLM